MHIPKAIKLKSGEYMIRLRVGGVEQYITDTDKSKCEKKARAVKAAFLADSKLKEQLSKKPTVDAAMELYIQERENNLSPLTVRGYEIIRENRFRSISDRRLDQIKESEWQGIINKEAALCAPKTLENAWAFLRSVAKKQGITLPDVTLPAPEEKPRDFLDHEEIPIFVRAVKDSPYAIPLLLALSSMRISEIDALRWENIPPNPKFIRVQGARVLTKENTYTVKTKNKTKSSARDVPILIPELREAIERCRKPSGKLMTCSQNTLRNHCKRICKEAGLPDISPHDLRRSFASLAYHLRMPERIAMEIGGWDDERTMHKIYTIISKRDIERYKTEMYNFFHSDARLSED